MNQLSQQLKQYLSYYSKNVDSINMEIDIGHHIEPRVFDKRISEKNWKTILSLISKNRQYSQKKEFSYTIYSHLDKKLFIDGGSEKKDGRMKCLCTKHEKQTVCFSEKPNQFDLKLSFLTKKMISSDLFPSAYEYHSVIQRDTISFNFHNNFLHL